MNEMLISVVTKETRLYLSNACEPFSFNFVFVIIGNDVVITTYLANLLSAINLNENPDGNHALKILNELNPIKAELLNSINPVKILMETKFKKQPFANVLQNRCF